MLFKFQLRRVVGSRKINIHSRCADIVNVFPWHMSVQQNLCRDMQALHHVFSKFNDDKTALCKIRLYFNPDLTW